MSWIDLAIAAIKGILAFFQNRHEELLIDAGKALQNVANQKETEDEIKAIRDRKDALTSDQLELLLVPPSERGKVVNLGLRNTESDLSKGQGEPK